MGDDWTMEPERLAQLHRGRFKHLSDEHFEEFLVECKLRGFSPWSKYLRAETFHDEATGLPRLRLSLTLEGLRAEAHITEAYAGCDIPVIVRGDGNFPASAAVTVYRLMNGQRMPFSAIAYWDECAQYPLNDFWERRPKMALGFRALQYALREAFPDRFGGLWAPEEMSTSGTESPKGKKPGKTESNLAGVTLAPDCRIQLEGEMVAMGYDTSDVRDRVIDSLIETFEELHGKDKKMFWGVAYAALKKNPGQFGPVPVRKLG
jgi:hypothetical protein